MFKAKKNEHRTLNVQHRTSNKRKKSSSLFDVQCSTFNVRCSHLIPTYLRKHIQRAHKILKSPLTELSIALVGDKKMSAIHLQFLSLPGPTDVLTFPLELDRKGRPLTGEIVICVPEARRRCRTTHQDLREELLLYALHGLLHLCGFDDRTDRGFKRMHRMEDKILNQLGVGAVYELGKDAG